MSRKCLIRTVQSLHSSFVFFLLVFLFLFCFSFEYIDKQIHWAKGQKRLDWQKNIRKLCAPPGKSSHLLSVFLDIISFQSCAIHCAENSDGGFFDCSIKKNRTMKRNHRNTHNHIGMLFFFLLPLGIGLLLNCFPTAISSKFRLPLSRAFFFWLAV